MAAAAYLSEKYGHYPYRPHDGTVLEETTLYRKTFHGNLTGIEKIPLVGHAMHLHSIVETSEKR
jgi:hypothetical protein